MFGQTLKSIRIAYSYTQMDLAAKLSAESNEFSKIDVVTISRWERGVTTPSNSKAVRVIRCLTNDVSPFLSLLAKKSFTSEPLEEFIKKRYETNVIKLTLAAFGLKNKVNSDVICHDSLMKKYNDQILMKLYDYHSLFNQDRLELFDIDLYLYQNEMKMHGYRFYDAHTPEIIIGSSISFFMDSRVIENEITRKGCNIDLRKSTAYNTKDRFSLYMVSVMITSGEVFKYNWVQHLKFISTHSNIVTLYVSVVTESVVPFLQGIGFEVVATKNAVKVGGIKIGRRRYEQCLMKIDTSVLLTSNEALSLMLESKLKSELLV